MSKNTQPVLRPVKVEHYTDEFGIIHQKDPIIMQYTPGYIEQLYSDDARQMDMQRIRMEYVQDVLGVTYTHQADCLEIGPGRGYFMQFAKGSLGSLEGYDIVDSLYSTVTQQEALSRQWDILFMYDVIEHLPSLTDLFKYKFKYAVLSVPGLPPLHYKGPDPTAELERLGWHHYKPNEHLHYFDPCSFKRFSDANKFRLLRSSNPEDALRSHEGVHPNIITYTIENLND